ncbi:MAG: hypothetical protein U9Q71_07895 [Pseudomonadota bacterium]|nr:hypothetical protein [Pseudomonadota bacterium]
MADLLQDDLLGRLRIDHQTLREAEAGFRALQQRGGAASGEISDYRDHLEKLRQRVADDCWALTQVSRAKLPVDLPCPTQPARRAGAADIDIASEQTGAEMTAALDAELSASLSAFDETLLREQTRVKSRKPHTESAESAQVAAAGQAGADGGQSAAEAMAGMSGAQAAGGETEDNSMAGQQGMTGMAGANGQAKDQATQAGQKSTAGSESGAGSKAEEMAAAAAAREGGSQDGGDQSKAGQSGTGRPGKGQSGERGAGSDRQQAAAEEDIPDGSDDDVVARQLREAAEKETDPELKKKLWEEYRKYKRGS